MKETGKTTKQTAMESIRMLAERSMSVHGEMIYRMDMVKSPGQMAAPTRVNTPTAKNMEKVPIIGLMDRLMWDNGIVERSVEKVPTHG